MRARLLIAVTLSAVVACNRRAPSVTSPMLAATCPADSSPPHGTSGAGPLGSISITLIDAVTGRPLDAGQAILQYQDGHRAHLDNSSPFQFTGLRNGRYVSGVTR